MQDGVLPKTRVKNHWEKETCGTRYGRGSDRQAYFNEISEARYRLEPYIPAFADFPSAGGKHILEIGVGAGTDFRNWCNYAAHATGLDLTEQAIALTDECLTLHSIPKNKYLLRTADAENLPFPDESFDLVYSWGVLHHTPDTGRAFQEVFRVLKPGGRIKAMIYHVQSWTALMLYLQHGPGRGKFGISIKEAVFDHLESPGTKVYTLAEAGEMLKEIGYSNVSLSTKLGPSDLLTIKRSEKYKSSFYKFVWRVYPSWLIRLLGHKYGLYLLIDAIKPG